LDIQRLPILSYGEICHKLQIDPDLKEWRGLFGVDDKIFNILVKPAFIRYVESAQLAPASETHHHSGPGGLVTHTQEVITLALRMRKGLQLPIGGSVAVINDKKHLWTYGVFAAGLLHDIGKLASSIRVQLHLRNGGQRLWNPHDEPMTTFDADSYQIAFIKTPYAYHHHLALSFMGLLPSIGRSWLANEYELMKQVCAHLRGDRYESGSIGEILEKADMQSTAANLQEPVPKRFSSAMPLIDRFIGLIRGWIQNKSVRININGAMAWVDTHGYCYFVCRSLAEKLVVDCSEKGINDVPQDPVRIYDVLQEHGYAIPNEDGKAIWTITVEGEGFTHRFTCLKFEARRLTPPTKILEPFKGKIYEGDQAPPPVMENVNKQSPDKEETQKSVIEEHVGTANKKPEDAAEEESLVFAAAKTPKVEAKGSENAILETEKKPLENADSQMKTDEIAENRSQISASSEALDYVPINHSSIKVPEVEPLRKTPVICQDVTETTEAGAEVNTTAIQIEEAAPSPTSQPEFKGLTTQNPKIASLFFQWLKKGLIEKTILINDPNAYVHIVKEGVFLLSPAIFKDFCIKHNLPETEHRTLSKKFDRLKLNIKTEKGLNIHPYWAIGESRAGKMNGRLIAFSNIYENDYPIPSPNKYMNKKMPGADG